MANFLDFLTIETVHPVEDLDQAITTHVSGDERVISDQNVAIEILNKGVDILVIARIEEDIEPVTTSVGIAPKASIEDIGEVRSNQNIISVAAT